MGNRRASLRIGGLGLAGFDLVRLSAFGLVANSLTKIVNGKAPERADWPKPRAKSIIFLHQHGGPSHIDTFDMKPAAPDGIRGEFRPISSSIPGLPITEHLPRWGQQLHLWAQVRSVHHKMKNHNSAGYYCLTGKAPPTDDQRLRDSLELYPAYGSVVAKILGPVRDGMPPFIAYPHIVRDGSSTPGQYASFLGKRFDPFFFRADPNQANFTLPELELPANVDLNRLNERRRLLSIVDTQLALQEQVSVAQGMNQFQEQALSILSSPGLKQALDLSKESDRLRDAYGRTTYGQSCLLARRLVEAGTRFVTVYFSSSIGGKGSEGWDTHQDNFTDLKNRLLPITDQTVPTLIEDLRCRGLLEDTLVVWMGEFGRGPKIGDRDGKGRNHWPDCYTVLMAGGGIRGGAIYGSSDPHGAYPASDPVRPESIAATMYWALGIDPQAEIYDTQDRPLPISNGDPIQSIFG
ncbi:MAG: DUF1501 domain-containing protein [Planctomycetales bacterium]|nr:DUF1501 domain-containing protein [Planctomycetales bacterium]